MARVEDLLRRLGAGETFVADGACGTMLQSRGLDTGKVPETWLLERPEQVRALHREYVVAGADLILSCSFGGTRFRLANDGLADRVVELNQRAADLAREVAGDHAWVVGDMGPTGQLLAPMGPLTPDEVSDAYAEQATGLVAGGADLLLIETMSDLQEAQAAIRGVQRVTDLPVICTFSFDSHGRTMMGLRPAQAARAIGPLVQGVGANCGHDPSEYVEFMAAMRREAPAAFLWAKPNAGLPRLGEDGLVQYDASPGHLADVAVQMHAAGAQIVGGCCGTTPAHIRAMAAALRQ